MHNPQIFLSTCEFSGDRHGAALIRELKEQLPAAEFFGVGGPQMAAAGMELLEDPTSRSTIGIVEALRNIGRMKGLLAAIGATWEKRRPDVAVWLDSGGFNLQMALEAKKRGIPVVCMFSPSAWAYWRGRAVKLAERVQLLLAVLPFEAEFYRKFGVPVVNVGHPVLDWVKTTETPQQTRNRLGVGAAQKLVALMPGSRRQEIAKLLPVMLEAATGLNAEQSIRWVLPVAASLDRSWLESFLQAYPVAVRLESGGVYDLLAAADAALIASGTATLEAAILKTPMIVIYRLSGLTLALYQLLESREHKGKPRITGLPNLIALESFQRTIVPEFNQENLTAANIAPALRRILNDASYQAAIRQDLEAVTTLVGPPGAMRRAAAEIAALIQKTV